MKTFCYKYIVTLCLAFICIDVCADNFEVDGIYYRTDWNDKTIALVTSGTNKYSGNVVIPETVYYDGNKLKVTTIGSSAFANCPNLTSIVIPNSITSVGRSAFYQCTGLTNVTLPNSIKEMEAAIDSYLALLSVIA